MVEELKIVDGTDGGKAPRPHRGLIKAVYDTVVACGGASEAQVRKYLPAAIESIGQVISRKKIHTALVNAVYRGYLIHDGPNNKWRVAPLSYYQSRQAFVKAGDSRYNEATDVEINSESLDREEIFEVEEVTTPMRITLTFSAWYLVVFAVMAAFAVGIIIERYVFNV